MQVEPACRAPATALGALAFCAGTWHALKRHAPAHAACAVCTAQLSKAVASRSGTPRVCFFHSRPLPPRPVQRERERAAAWSARARGGAAMASGGETDFPAKIPRSAADYEKARGDAAASGGEAETLCPALATPGAAECRRRVHAAAATLPLTPSLQVHKVPTAAEYEKLNRPYAAPTEKLPTMSENWSCAPRHGARCRRGR